MEPVHDVKGLEPVLHQHSRGQHLDAAIATPPGISRPDVFIPNEVLAMVFEYLSKESLMPGMGHRHRSCVAVRQTCRHWNSVATPILYRHIVIREVSMDTSQRIPLILFVRTMAENPELRTHVRSLKCEDGLVDVLFDDDMSLLCRELQITEPVQPNYSLQWAHASSAFRELTPGTVDIFLQAGLHPGLGTGSRRTPERLFGAVLSMLPRLQHLDICGSPGYYQLRELGSDLRGELPEDACLRAFSSPRHTDQRRERDPPHDWRAPGALTSALQGLKSVVVDFPDGEHSPASQQSYIAQSASVRDGFVGRLNLERRKWHPVFGILELANNVTFLAAIRGFGPRSAWPSLTARLTEMVALDVPLSGPRMRIIGKAAHLERLTLRTHRHARNLVWWDNMIDWALFRLKDTLRYLDLQVWDWGNRGQMYRLFGTSGALRSLPKLALLKELQINTRALFGPEPRFAWRVDAGWEEHDWSGEYDVVYSGEFGEDRTRTPVELDRLLPPNIETLDINEQWDSPQWCCQDGVCGWACKDGFVDRLNLYDERVASGLESFAKRCQSHMPALRRFCWRRNLAMVRSRGRNAWNFNRWGAIAAEFARAGVEFEVTWERADLDGIGDLPP